MLKRVAKDVLRPVVLRFLAGASWVKLRVSAPHASQLEIGSGPKKREGWVTLDQCLGADVVWDLRHTLPFRDSCFLRVYCSHVLEHFSYPELRKVLREVYRVLKPGGQFLIAVPDASLYVEAYLGKRHAIELLRYQPAIISDKGMDVLNYMFYMNGHHRFMFDRENLAFHCEAAGFSQCGPRSFDATLDMASRDYETLYMLCEKPQQFPSDD